ncbi:hypothetical protein RJ639_015097 [Escallonia herrerae]|uniref:Cytochrome P450 n=1 Tax=Escallonia herrerae TaxID=1293975 RepID=A0AA88VGH8_9ASTE|nr:hypothetical protein RJ639_015097 [Escallonia herrerae]
MWIDVVAMHHGRALWGDIENEFRPERFKEDLYGGCKHKMGYLPFGFGGRMCVGKSLTTEYKIVLILILTSCRCQADLNHLDPMGYKAPKKKIGACGNERNTSKTRTYVNVNASVCFPDGNLSLSAESAVKQLKSPTRDKLIIAITKDLHN